MINVDTHDGDLVSKHRHVEGRVEFEERPKLGNGLLPPDWRREQGNKMLADLLAEWPSGRCG